MVSLDAIELSNERIRSALKPGLVAVFVGATNGVGETTVRQFAKYAAQPRVYIIGRSEEAGNRIAAECKALNPGGTFTFLKRETSLMRAVDETCNEIASKEHTVNLLFLSVGTLQRGTGTFRSMLSCRLVALKLPRDRGRPTLPCCIDHIWT